MGWRSTGHPTVRQCALKDASGIAQYRARITGNASTLWRGLGAWKLVNTATRSGSSPVGSPGSADPATCGNRVLRS